MPQEENDFPKPAIEASAQDESDNVARFSPVDALAQGISTAGVGYLPLAPGTWGSMIGILVYLALLVGESNLGIVLLHKGWKGALILAWLSAGNLLVLFLFCLIGVWSAGRTARLLGKEDPKEVVIDEIVGQLIVFLFIPFTTTWWIILSGFLLFRIFDIWKPYPIDDLQALPGGLGICADDVLAGVYAGICLSAIYAFSLGF